jgi:uncharacterized protein YqeY
MALEQNIMTELKAAMLAKDEAKLRGLRAIKSAILLAKTSGTAGELSEADEIKLLQKLVKQRKESLEIYEKQGREDLASGERQEIEVIEKFLPQMMSEEQVRAELKSIIASVGATSAAEMGKVMGAATKHFAGKADNKMVSALVKELLGA